MAEAERPDYDGRVFRSSTNSAGGDVDTGTTFRYRQRDDIVWATYDGGAIAVGTLIAKIDEAGNLDVRYQHVTTDGELKTGRCRSRPERLPDGRLRIHEDWEWTGGAQGTGASTVDEVTGTREGPGSVTCG
jgi:hypothetical protein